MKVSDQQYAMTLVGGDQLTVGRIRGAQRIRGNSVTSQQRFDTRCRGLACQNVLLEVIKIINSLLMYTIMYYAHSLGSY